MLLDVDLLVSAFLDKLIRREEESRRQAVFGKLTPQPSPATTPWEGWELDNAFFTALSRWTLNHPETTLDRVMENISVGLDNAKELFALIPDSPFPARGLVTALAHLLKLGVTIFNAKRDAQGFAKDIVRWVGQVKGVFESAKGGRFTRSAWRDLRSMRDLIEEICHWAVARLEDRRWLRVGHGLIIQKEITEFRARITDARGLFQDLSAINLARGIDSIKRDLRTLRNNQHVVLIEIKKIRETQEHQLSYIIDEMEAQKQAAAREQFFSQTLATCTVTNPTYDKQGKRPCDEDTRVEVLAQIRQWVNDIAPGSQNFLWLTGDPGCGKSAITASLTRECKDEDILWAQFFINRNNVETTAPNAYFPSIARQLADRSPDVAQTIHDTLKAKRSLMDGISADQAAKLFVDSIRMASLLEPDRPVVVVIDGLDETDRSHLKDTATIFSTLFTALSSYSNVKVFISSRTEDEIRNPFIQPLHDKHVKRIHLETSDPSSIRDVCTFILRSLKRLVEEHDLNWEIWPGESGAVALGVKASGLFIWAVTAVKFVQEQIDSHGVECLNDVLDLLTADNLDDINTLYELILRVTLRDKASEWEFEKFRRIIGAIVFLQEPLCLDDLAKLLDLRKMPANAPVDIQHFVRRLRTVLVTGTDVVDGSTIPRLHKSFFEFITSTHVDPRFRVEPEYANMELAVQCLRQLSAAHAAVNNVKLSVTFRYAFRFWSAHLLQTRQRTGIVIMGHNPAIPTLPELNPVSPVQYASTIKSPLRLDFFLAKSKIQSTLEDSHDVRHWDLASGQDTDWHTESVSCLAFAPNGEQVVSCSADKCIKFWSTSTGRWISTIQYSSPVLAVAFSPDGEYVVSGSSDHTLCLWNARTKLSVGLPFRGHTGPVTCITFSPDGRFILSGSADKTCRLWSETGQPIGSPFGDHSSGVSSVAFSPGGVYICSGTEGGNIQFWDAKSGQPWGPRFTAHKEQVNAVAPSPDREHFASGSKDGTVHHWNAALSSIHIEPPMEEHGGAVLSVAFSPDGQHVFCGSSDTVRVAAFGHADKCTGKGYDYENHTAVEGHRKVNHAQVTSLAFSPDGTHFACAGLGVRIYKLHFRIRRDSLGRDSSVGSSTSDTLRKKMVDATKFQLNLAPVQRHYDQTTSPENAPASHIQSAEKELRQALSNVQEVGWTYSAELGNSNLEGVQWFASKFQDNAERTSVLWAFFDDHIARANTGEGAVTVFVKTSPAVRTRPHD